MRSNVSELDLASIHRSDMHVGTLWDACAQPDCVIMVATLVDCYEATCAFACTLSFLQVGMPAVGLVVCGAFVLVDMGAGEPAAQVCLCGYVSLCLESLDGGAG